MAFLKPLEGDDEATAVNVLSYIKSVAAEVQNTIIDDSGNEQTVPAGLMRARERIDRIKFEITWRYVIDVNSVLSTAVGQTDLGRIGHVLGGNNVDLFFDETNNNITMEWPLLVSPNNPTPTGQ